MVQAKCWDARHHLLAELRKAGIEIPVTKPEAVTV